MRKAEIYYNRILAGTLTEEDSSHFIFTYDDFYFIDDSQPAISLSLPKSQKEYQSEYLFPFFYNMLSEGVNLAIQSSYLKIDERDVLSILGATARFDTIGAVTIKLIDAK